MIFLQPARSPSPKTADGPGVLSLLYYLRSDPSLCKPGLAMVPSPVERKMGAQWPSETLSKTKKRKRGQRRKQVLLGIFLR